MENRQTNRGEPSEAKRILEKMKPARTYPVDLLTAREAACAARMHPDTIRRWIRQRRIPAYGWRGMYRVNLKDLLPLIGGEELEES